MRPRFCWFRVVFARVRDRKSVRRFSRRRRFYCFTLADVFENIISRSAVHLHLLFVFFFFLISGNLRRMKRVEAHWAFCHALVTAPHRFVRFPTFQFAYGIVYYRSEQYIIVSLGIYIMWKEPILNWWNRSKACFAIKPTVHRWIMGIERIVFYPATAVGHPLFIWKRGLRLHSLIQADLICERPAPRKYSRTLFEASIPHFTESPMLYLRLKIHMSHILYQL